MLQHVVIAGVLWRIGGGKGVIAHIAHGSGTGVIPGPAIRQGHIGQGIPVGGGEVVGHLNIGVGLGNGEAARGGAGVIALAGDLDGGRSRIDIVGIGEFVVGALGQRFAVQGDGDILPAGLFRIAVIDVTAAHLHLCAIQRFGVYGKGKADFRAGGVIAGNSEGFGMTVRVKPGNRPDGELCRTIRGKGGGAIRKARSRRDGVICAGGQRNRYRLVSGVGDGHGLPVGCFRIVYRFAFKV